MESFTFTHVCHATFMRLQGAFIPWIISITRIAADFETFVIHTYTGDLDFNHEDILFNTQHVNFYPRPSNFQCDRIVERHELENGYLERFVSDELVEEGEFPKIAAADKKTYYFLLKEVPFLFLRCLLLPSLIQKNRTFSMAYYRSVPKDDRNEGHYMYCVHCTFIQYKGAKVPWHLCLTSTAHPTESVVFGLKTENLIFNPADRKFNETNVENFPRSPCTHLDYDFAPDDFEGSFKDIYEDVVCKDGWHAITTVTGVEPTWHALMATGDEPTYLFLVRLFHPCEIMLIPSKSDSEHQSFAIAHRLSRENLLPPIKNMFYI